MKTKQLLALLVLLLWGSVVQARVYKCVQGDTTVFSQQPCSGQVQIIEGESLRANSIPAAAPQTKKSNNARQRANAHPVLSSLARSRLLNLQTEIERWLRSSADKAERARLLAELDKYSHRLEQIREQVKNATAVSVQLDSEEAQLRREHRGERALLARLLFEHEMLRNQKLYGIEPLAKK